MIVVMLCDSSDGVISSTWPVIVSDRCESIL